MNSKAKANLIESKSAIFEVFFDGECPLCRREIDMIRRKDKHSKLLLTDISASEFDAGLYGKPLDELMQAIHGRTSDGQWVLGVDVFREIYGRLGFRASIGISRLPVIKQLLDVFYYCFSWLRYKSAVRRMSRKKPDCIEQCPTLTMDEQTREASE